ncbi:MAG: MFS transporter [Curvibacter lanceolatus]|uniref:MFS transporter n=1 Tax=Curvibacter lanceolatus TaxID=86182 RepID=UPI000364901B|nr:MFS transporter [Curvibacter lanceolatus]MBV5290817.1 MFS transporter [Curvibacter lanceolatus]
MNRHLLLLTLCQGLFLTNNVVFIAINGLVGLSLAPVSWMATLPVMGYVVGGALSTALVARSQARFGRRGSFQIGLAVAFVSALTCLVAALTRQFWLLCAATLVAGYYSANGQLYRFAAAELAAPAFREKAVSLVLAGGLIGAVAGPNLAKYTRDLGAVPFAGAYAALMGVALLAMACMSLIRFPEPARPPHAGAAPVGRPLGEIMRQPVFVVAALSAALGYGVMNLLMAATPLAMQVCGLGFDDAALVLQWHVVGMFAPGFFTGHLIKRYGPLPVMGVGVLLNAGCVAVALSGVDLQQVLVALLLLGLGWNLLFTGATTLAMRAYRPEEKDRAQAAINFCVFGTMAFTAFASGALVTTQGWTLLNLGSLLPVLLTGLGLGWLGWQQRQQRQRKPARA